jgi:predicted ATPase
MITKFRVNNFKSLLNAEFRPVGLNLIIGPNNAGKTNLCSALRFLALTSEHSLDAAALMSTGERWNLTNVYVSAPSVIEMEIECSLRHENEDLHFNYSLSLDIKKTDIVGADTLSVKEERLAATGGRFNQTPLVKNTAGQTSMLHEEGFVQQRLNTPYHAQAKVAANATMLSQLFELENNPRAILFRNYLRSWAYYNLSPDALRLPDVAKDDGTLLHNGANLSRALYALHNEKPRLERKLIDFIKQVEPKLDLFSFLSPDPEHVHLFFEDDKEHRFSTKSISDGTLRFLAIAYVVLMSEQIATLTGFPPLTLIEEPENGLYIGQLKPLIQHIDPSGSSGQFIFTSHSPYFIDLFDNNLAGVHLVKRGSPSSILTQPNQDKISRLLGDMSLGELHFRELLA